MNSRSDNPPTTGEALGAMILAALPLGVLGGLIGWMGLAASPGYTSQENTQVKSPLAEAAPPLVTLGSLLSPADFVAQTTLPDLSKLRGIEKQDASQRDKTLAEAQKERQQTQRRLEQARASLQAIENPQQAAAQVAELRARLEGDKARLAAAERPQAELQRKVANIRLRGQQAQAALNSLKASVEAFARDQEALKGLLNPMEIQLARLEKDEAKNIRQILEMEERLRPLRERRRNLTLEQRNLQLRIDEATGALGELKKEFAEWNEELAKGEPALTELRAAVQDSMSALSNLEKDGTTSAAKKNELEAEVRRLESELAQLDATIASSGR